MNAVAEGRGTLDTPTPEEGIAGSDHRLLVDAIVGAGFASMEHAMANEAGGLVRFTGNQWNPDWSWNREALARLPEADLRALHAQGYALKGGDQVVQEESKSGGTGGVSRTVRMTRNQSGVHCHRPAV